MNGTFLGIVINLAIFGSLIALARQVLNRWASTDSDNDAQILHGNMAVAIRHSAFYLALGMALCATLSLPGRAVGVGGIAIETLLWGLGVMVAMFLALLVSEYLVLPKVNNSRAVGQNNVAVALVEGASLFGAAIIMGGTVQGTGPLWPTAVFFALGQFAMVASVWLYEWVDRETHFQTEIGVAANQAAAIVLSGRMIAISIVIRNAVTGDSVNWAADLTGALISFVVGAVALFVVEWVVDAALLPNVRVRQLVREKRAEPMVLLAAISIASALFVTAVSPF